MHRSMQPEETSLWQSLACLGQCGTRSQPAAACSCLLSGTALCGALICLIRLFWWSCSRALAIVCLGSTGFASILQSYGLIPVEKARRRDTSLVLIGSASQLALASADNPAYTANIGRLEPNACTDDSQCCATQLRIASGLGLHTVRLDGKRDQVSIC